MNHREVVSVLQDIETQIDVNSFWIDGVQVWPLLRRDIWIYLLGLDKLQISCADDNRQINRRSINEYPDGRYRFRDDQNLHLIEDLRQKLSPELERNDILFWSRREDHTEIFENGVIDRIVDPMLWFVRDKGYKACKVSRADLLNWRGLEQFQESVKLPIDWLHENRTARVVWGSAVELLAEIKKIIPELPLTHEHIVSSVRRLNSRADYFDVVLDIVKPRLVMLGVYYSPDALAMIHACRRRVIPTVDIQHGKQGLHHAMYGGWSVMPARGYSVLPDYFWTWGKASSRLIRSSLPRAVLRPRPVTGGNRWLALWSSSGNRISVLPEVKQLLEQAEGFERTILVTLQPLREPVPDELLQAMAESPAGWFWLIRTHPHQRRKIENIEQRVGSTGLKQYDIRCASNAPLYPLLKRADVHITCWSSVAYEALALNKPTVLIDSTAQKLYGEYIRRRLFSYADASDEILRLISELPDKTLPGESEAYIEVSEEQAAIALRRCLNRNRIANYFQYIGAVLGRRLLASPGISA